eukprot:Gb_26370 [translate_table: standard]
MFHWLKSTGHEVGNHTMYDVASWSLPLDAFEEQLLAVDHQLENYFFKDASQMPIKWFRPFNLEVPGSFGNNDMQGHGFYTRRMVRIAQAHGYRTALGSLFPLDTLFTDLGKHIAKYMLWRVHPGAIIILHDREPQKTQTAEDSAPLQFRYWESDSQVHQANANLNSPSIS